MNPVNATIAALLSTALPFLAACGNEPPAAKAGAQQAAPAETAAASPALPEGLVVRGPANGTHVAAAKAAARQGEEITLVGRIGGSANPYVADRAIFTIVDPALKACSDMDDPDHCDKPWDYCCEDRAKLRAGTATIEIAGADGRPIAVAVRGVQGLDPLVTVAVTGTVTERNDAGLLVVRAKRIEVR